MKTLFPLFLSLAAAVSALALAFTSIRPETLLI
jgi:hypothetical protein